MWAGPHVGEDQGPEVDDGQAVRVHRPLRLLGDEVVDHAEVAGGQDEADGVVAVPPLDHGVLHAGIQGIRFGERGGGAHAVDDVQQRHRNNIGGEEPVGYVDMLDLAFDQGAEEDDGVGDPDDGDQDGDGPFE